MMMDFSELTHDWITRIGPAAPSARLICLPHAGGAPDDFAHWRDGLAEDVELCLVRYPDADLRAGLGELNDPMVIVRCLVDEISALPAAPFVLFGHSLGGLLSFECARLMRAQNAPAPRALFVSACKAPMHLPSPFIREAAELPEEGFVNAVRTLGGLPEDLLNEPALREILLAKTRSDFQMVSRYRYAPAPPLDVPLSLLCARSDPHVPPESQRDWGVETTGNPAIHLFDGGHFYLEDPANLDTALGLINAAFAPETTTARI